MLKYDTKYDKEWIWKQVKYKEYIRNEREHQFGTGFTNMDSLVLSVKNFRAVNKRLKEQLRNYSLSVSSANRAEGRAN